MRSRVVLGMLLVMSFDLGMSAQALIDPFTPVAASGEEVGPGWRSFTVDVTGGLFALEAYAIGPASGIEKGFLQVAFFWEDGRPLGNASRMVRPGYDGFSADIDVAGITASHEQRERYDMAGGMVNALYMNCPPAPNPCTTPVELQWRGTFKAIAWTAGDIERWTWAIQGAGVTLLDTEPSLDTEQGRSTFVYTSDDFDGALNVQANSSASGGNVGVRAQMGLSRSVSATRTLVGYFGTDNPYGVHDLSVTRPDGSLWECGRERLTQNYGSLCTFYSFATAASLGAGTYTFNASSIGDNGAPFGDIALAGADAFLPD